jgi:hypothetical protein
MTKEWQEATNKRALEMNLNPITGACVVIPSLSSMLTVWDTGISSEGYKGTGFVTESK